MARRALLCVLACGCLNVPAYQVPDGGGGDGARDGRFPNTATVVLHAHTADGAALFAQAVHVQPVGTEDGAYDAQTDPNGAVAIAATGSTIVYVDDETEHLLVVLAGVSPGDAIQLGADTADHTGPLVVTGQLSDLTNDTTEIYAALPCGHEQRAYALDAPLSLVVDASCPSGSNPLLVWESESGNILHAATGTWNPPATTFSVDATAAPAEMLALHASNPSLVGIAKDAPAHLWAFTHGKRLLAEPFTFDLQNGTPTGFTGIDPLVEVEVSLAPDDGRRPTFLRERVATQAPAQNLTIAVGDANLAPWLSTAPATVPMANTVQWTLAQARTGFGETQLVIVDAVVGAQRVRWIAPGSAVTALADKVEQLSFPPPIFNQFSFDGAMVTDVTVRLVHAEGGDSIYDALLQTADRDAAHDDFTNATGITHVAVAGETVDPDNGRDDYP
ncbi:MAG TPA: hypothetical protein VGM88_31025 [Kofleriaceae bacterium]|jgi:hypothetical protein